jgi:1-acyl-sn-glycerol-3-phosphate acyltransferase
MSQLFSKLAGHLRGIFTLILYSVNLTFWFTGLFFFSLLRLIPIQLTRHYCNQIMQRLPVYWITCNGWIQRATTDIVWDIVGLTQVQKNHWYLLICNHQSWTDILVLQHVFNKKIPSLKFFLKRELLWTLPLASWACWLLDFPFVYRHSRQKLEKNPHLKGKDLEITRDACQRFKKIPSTVTNFVEGTRFTREKAQKQNSPYRYLLQPRAAGIAFTLAILKEQIDEIIDVTLVYPDKQINLWDFLCGRIRKITLHINCIPVTPNLIGSYETDRKFRAQFQTWLNQIWRQKDNRIALIYDAINTNSQLNRSS